MELQKLFVTLALKANEYRQGLQDAGKHADGFSGHVGNALSKMKGIAIGAMAAVGAAIAAGFALAVKSSIEVNAQLETTTLQFETLMGDADKAAEHVAGLFKFAERTPFETGPIIEASLKLQTFGGEALNTQENLLLLGDAAAATNAPIDELGFWVGRLYANLEAGQPFGEAAMRLQELAVMSPQARQRMMELQEAGASASEIFAYFQEDLEQFTGAMEKQAGTWEGMTSTIKDQIQLLLADAMKPFFEEGKDGMAELIALLNDPALREGIIALGAELGKVAEQMADAFGSILLVLAKVGQQNANLALAEQLKITREELNALYAAARELEGFSDWDFLSAEQALQVEQQTMALMRERYGQELLLIELAEVSNAARAEQEEATKRQIADTQELAPAISNVTGAVIAWRIENDLLGNSTKGLAGEIERAGNGIGGLTAAVATNVRANIEAEAAALRLSEAFAGLVGDYTTTLPGAMEPLVGITNNVAGAQSGLAVNVGGVKQAIFDQLVQMNAAPEVIAAYGVAIGVMTQEQANAALMAATVQVKIEELAGAIAEGMPVEDALADLDSFIAKVQNEFIPAAEGAAQDVPAHFESMVEPVGETAHDIGEALMTGVVEGINDAKPLATEAADTAAQDVINATNTKYGVESPSTVFAGIGKNLMEGLSGGIAELVPRLVGEMTGIGGQIIDGLIAGVESAKGALRGAIGSVGDLIPDWIRQFLGIASPAKKLVPVGESIVFGIIQGIENATPELIAILNGLSNALVDALDVGRAFGGLAGSLSKRFEASVLDPLREAMTRLDPAIMPGGKVYEELFALWGAKFNMADGQHALSQLRTAQAQLQAIVHYNNQIGNSAAAAAAMQQLFYVESSINALTKRNALEDEYIAQQEKLAALEKARADLDFLKGQMELIKLVSENAKQFPPGFLNGVEFGLMADPAVLMAKMVEAMERLVRNAQYELNSINRSPALVSTTPGTERTTTMNVQTQNINGGQHIYLYDTEESELERLGVLAR